MRKVVGVLRRKIKNVLRAFRASLRVGGNITSVDGVGGCRPLIEILGLLLGSHCRNETVDSEIDDGATLLIPSSSRYSPLMVGAEGTGEGKLQPLVTVFHLNSSSQLLFKTLLSPAVAAKSCAFFLIALSVNCRPSF